MWFEIVVIIFLFIITCVLGDVWSVLKSILAHLAIHDQVKMTTNEFQTMINLKKMWKKFDDE
ncbi:hypothetical protein CP371_07285 [Pediococcus acidilactici]|nr:hypothetical protein [Pediococcus acidilactici]MCQ0052551.1 hypothetical protein [Pediococcus acidilactici]MCQ0054257.1 hypothetical protein [Pediococcus acidilactici]MCQ0061703.1 hypothetical protein [Pediococcus acidilactici]MCQ0068803.1 hypothetical protein [Pediococcus acidilactici]